jgi:hypothetical protein
MVNYGSSPFDKLTAAPYVSQYVGNTLDAQQATMDRLQGRYDAGEAMQNQISKIARALPFAPEEEYLRTQVESYYNDLLRGYAQRGDYHRLLPHIQSEAATIESMYKMASVRTEQVQKQREAIAKTKAPDEVKDLYSRNLLFAGESSFDPGVGFRFGRLNPALPTDAQDISKYVLDMADKVEKVKNSFKGYRTQKETNELIASLGLNVDDPILKEAISQTERNPKMVEKVLYTALMKNPQIQQALQQSNLAKAYRLNEPTLDAILTSQGMNPEEMGITHLDTKRNQVAQLLTEEETNQYVSMAVGAKAGILEFSKDQTLARLKAAGANTKADPSVTGIVYTGDGKAVTQATWNHSDFMKQFAEQDALATLPADKGGLQGAERAKALHNRQNMINIFKNMTSGFLNDPSYNQFAKSVLPELNIYGTENTPTTRILTKIFETAEAAGVNMGGVPMKKSTVEIGGTFKEIPNWEAALKQVLYMVDPTWLDTESGSKDRKLFTEAVQELFNGSVGKALDAHYGGTEKTVSLTPRFLQGGVFDDLGKTLTSFVKANPSNFSIVDRLDGNGTPVYADNLETYLSRIDSKNYNTGDYKIREWEKDPVTGSTSFALVVPGKSGRADHVRIIGSKGTAELGERINSLGYAVSQYEKKAKVFDDWGEPQFDNPSDNTGYRAAKLRVVQSVYSDVLGTLRGLDSKDRISNIPMNVRGGQNFEENKMIVFNKEPDINNINTGKFVYTARIFDKADNLDKILTTRSLEDLFYRIYNYNKNLSSDEE